MSNKKEFSSTYKLDYKMHKEFSRSYLATIKSSSIILFLIAVALVINMIYGNYQNVMLFGVLFIIFILISKITGRSKIVYKRSKFLNNNEDIETTVNINEEKIIMTSKNGNITNYSFDRIIGIVETKNLLILKLKYNMGIIIDKSNLTGGTKDELIEFLFSVCKNIKTKKVVCDKIWLILRRSTLVIFVILFVLSVILFTLKHYKADYYIDILEQNNYNVTVERKLYNGYNTKQFIISKDDEHTTFYMFEFGSDKDAKRNIKYWANIETEENIKSEYIIEDTKDYQKYVIDDNNKYVILIRKDNYVFYGIANLEYKEELDNIVNIIDSNMK